MTAIFWIAWRRKSLPLKATARWSFYTGNYSDYAEKKLSMQQDRQAAQTALAEKEKKADTRVRNQKLKFSYQEAKEYETIEADIETLEQKIQQCDNDMAANSTNFVKLNDIGKIKMQLEEQLTEKMERWEYLMEKAEQIAAQK